jgi:HTH-type transcriptional regulator, sugar sensing transcriptional regulator
MSHFTMEEQVLRDIGLTERETKVYLALIELGESTVGPIATKTKIQHAKIYPTLDKLIARGLVAFVTKSKTKHFQTTNPKQLLSMIKEKEEAIRSILPRLELKKKLSTELQTTRVYEGYDAIKSLFNQTISKLSKDDFYYAFSFKDEYHFSTVASRYFRQIHLQLAEKKVDDKMLSDISIKKQIKQNYKEIKNINLKFSKMHLPIGLVITKNQVINMIWGERPTAIEIVSSQISKQYKEFFEEMWDLAKK